MVAQCRACALSWLAPMDVEERIAFVMSGGTEGVLSPHITVFARKHGNRLSNQGQAAFYRYRNDPAFSA